MPDAEKKPFLARTWVQMVLIYLLSLASGVLINWWRPLSLPWVFQADKTAEPGNASGRAEVGLPYLLEALRRDDVAVIDAREEPFYRFGHIPGAVNVPPDSLERELPALLEAIPAHYEIIVYCSDRFCPMAENVILRLASVNRPARLFSPGYIGWEEAGHKIEVSP